MLERCVGSWLQVSEHQSYLDIAPLCWMEEEERMDIFYLTMRSTHFIYGFMVSDTW